MLVSVWRVDVYVYLFFERRSSIIRRVGVNMVRFKVVGVVRGLVFSLRICS